MGKMQKITTKIIYLKLEVPPNNTNFQHKDGLSYHDQAMDTKSTPQIFGISMSITVCWSKR